MLHGPTVIRACSAAATADPSPRATTTPVCQGPLAAAVGNTHPSVGARAPPHGDHRDRPHRRLPVAQAFAGHAPAGVTDRYVHAGLAEVAAAVAVNRIR